MAYTNDGNFCCIWIESHSTRGCGSLCQRPGHAIVTRLGELFPRCCLDDESRHAQLGRWHFPTTREYSRPFVRVASCVRVPFRRLKNCRGGYLGRRLGMDVGHGGSRHGSYPPTPDCVLVVDFVKTCDHLPFKKHLMHVVPLFLSVFLLVPLRRLRCRERWIFGRD